MNKLYTIKFTLKNGYVISVWSGWNKDDAQTKMRMNPESGLQNNLYSGVAGAGYHGSIP